MGSLYKQKGSKFWWVKYYVNGRPVRESTGTAKETEAKRFLKEREGRAASGQQILPRSDRILYDEAADDLRRYYRTTKTRNLEEAEYRFKNLNPFFRGMKVKNIGPSEVTDYIEKRQDEGAADKTINNELEVLVKVLRLAYENGKLLRIPVIHKLKVNNVRKGFFEPEMFERVRKLLPEDYQLAITIAYTYGWRMQSEILTLEWLAAGGYSSTGRDAPPGPRLHQK